MENALTDLVKQGPTVAVLIIVLYKLFGLYTSQQNEYKEIIDELKEVIRENTTAINNLMHYNIEKQVSHNTPVPRSTKRQMVDGD